MIERTGNPRMSFFLFVIPAVGFEWFECKGEANNEGTADPRFTLDADRPVMCHDGPLDDRESESYPTLCPTPCLVDTIEAVNYLFLILAADSDTGIPNPNLR